MSTRFFSSRDVEQDEPLERQQVLLLAALRDAYGVPVSYAELRAAGIEFPASVISELELMGVQIERCYEQAERRRQLVGVRLDPARDDPSLSCQLTEDVRAPEPLFESAPIAGARWLAPSAFVVAAGLLVTLVVVVLSAHGGNSGHEPAQPRTRSALAAAPTRSATNASAPSRQSTQTQTTHTPQLQPTSQSGSTAVSAALAAQLEAQGHQLLQAGQYTHAVPVLKRAVAATGESLAGCVQPASEPCLTYAYALYDLGRALLLSGSPAAAVGVLEHRMQIQNQQPVVAAELESARRQLG